MLLLAFLLLLGSSSVNIPSALGVTTVVGVSYVVGVPAVAGIPSVVSIHVSFCYCWGPAVADILSFHRHVASLLFGWRPCCLTVHAVVGVFAVVGVLEIPVG
jgi:hypothetical protein